ncbi:MAG: oxygen-independent coproporphyrinogen III oxidase [Pseudomonadota bacterium]
MSQPSSATKGAASGVPTAGDFRFVDPVLRAKYDVRGPRYTSYPPATHFAPLKPEQVQQCYSERNALDPDPGLSLYVHVPFCKARCLFCACHTLTGGQAKGADSYVAALIRDMKLAADWVNPARPVRQVAFGGGTPNFLTVEETDYLLDALEAQWSVAEGAELSAEIDPRQSTPEKLDAFLRHGFNRFSLGIQDFNHEVIDRVRRGTDEMKVEEVVEHLRGRGCQEINFDFIYGLPGQSVDTARATARQAVAFGPTRIALYSYAHVPWLYKHQEALARAGLPEPDLKASIFLAMTDVFSEAGYISIGMDHFALPQDRLAKAAVSRTLRRNFMGYTTGRGLDILGFGASAISSVGRCYAQNIKDIDSYRSSLLTGQRPLERGYLLDTDDLIRRELLLELFCNFHVDLRALETQFGIDAQTYFAQDLRKLDALAQDGLVTWNRDAIDVTELGRLFVRNVCMTFDRHLENDPGRRMYSKTV